VAQKILIVDDEVDILRALEYRFKKAGYETLTARNGVEALNLMQKEIPDLLIIDYYMPKMNGHEAIKRIRNDESLKHLPIILFTASVGKKTTLKAEEAGADDYIMKPYDFDEVLEKVKKLLGR
jgi:DNA-binding response OmpR family regulator